jgi:hypothetical protein
MDIYNLGDVTSTTDGRGAFFHSFDIYGVHGRPIVSFSFDVAPKRCLPTETPARPQSWSGFSFGSRWANRCARYCCFGAAGGLAAGAVVSPGWFS